MKFPNLVAKVFHEPWLITPDRHRAIQDVLLARLNAEEVLEPKAFLELPARESYRPAVETWAPGVGAVQVNGVLGKRMSQVDLACGGCDIDQVGEALAEAEGRSDLETLVVWFDSPGGTVTGIPELGAQVERMGKTKRVVGYTDTLMASAAYWVGAQATDVVATPSAQVGSIGVYLALLDSSRAFEAEGLRVELFKAGKLKAAGMPGVEMTAEVREHFQAGVDEVYDDFRGAVSHRGLGQEVMEGQVFSGRAGAENGLVDFTVNGPAELVEVLRRLG